MILEYTKMILRMHQSITSTIKELTDKYLKYYLNFHHFSETGVSPSHTLMQHLEHAKTEPMQNIWL